MCIFMDAYELGRRARIAGKQRASNPFAEPLHPDNYTAQRIIYCWDAGWIFGERAASSFNKATIYPYPPPHGSYEQEFTHG